MYEGIFDVFTAIGSNVAIRLANLPLSRREQTTMFASICHAMVTR